MSLPNTRVNITLQSKYNTPIEACSTDMLQHHFISNKAKVLQISMENFATCKNNWSTDIVCRFILCFFLSMRLCLPPLLHLFLLMVCSSTVHKIYFLMVFLTMEGATYVVHNRLDGFTETTLISLFGWNNQIEPEPGPH